MSNGYSFQRYPSGPTPDPKRVGAILAEKAAQNAAGSGDSDSAPLGGGGDLLSGVANQVNAYATSDRGTMPQGRLAPTGGDGTGTPGIETAPPPLASMPSQTSSNPTARPETVTVDDDFDPMIESSASATASALSDAQRRTTGGASGRGKVQNPSPATPLQSFQFQRMGLSPVEIAFLQQGGALKDG